MSAGIQIPSVNPGRPCTGRVDQIAPPKSTRAWGPIAPRTNIASVYRFGLKPGGKAGGDVIWFQRKCAAKSAAKITAQSKKAGGYCGTWEAATACFSNGTQTLGAVGAVTPRGPGA